MLLLFSVLSARCLQADWYYEGIEMFRQYEKIDYSWLVQFLPFNPTIIEAGAFFGEETIKASKTWPCGSIYAFEPNPYAFTQLRERCENANLENVKVFRLALNTFNGKAPFYVCNGMYGIDPSFGYASSLLPVTKEMEVYAKGPMIAVSCITLDDWCLENHIDKIDILRLELEGMELPILQLSQKTLQNCKILLIKTIFHPYREKMTHYDSLKHFLESSNFVLLSHWFNPGIEGRAIFLSREVFDAYFK